MEPRPVALVTGAARRIGRAIALELAGAGWDLAVHHRGAPPPGEPATGHAGADDAAATVAALQARGAAAAAFAADLADEAQCEALVPAVRAHFGRIDAVINNASLFEHDELASFRYATAERHWRANTAAPVVLARALAQALAPGGGRGCVVNLLDQKLWNPNPDHLSYTLSKAALQAATAMLAQALAPTVRVCAVAPGVTLPSGPMSDAEFTQAQRLLPLQRGAAPEDIARAVRYLLEAGAVTGSTLLVDGGQHLAAQPRDVLFLVRAAGAA